MSSGDSPSPGLRKRKLGRTHLYVSEISLGCVEIGLDYGIAPEGKPRRPSEAEAKRILHTALDLGVNHLDTARAYGESEAIIGRALKGRRDEFVLTTKIPVQKQAKLSTAELREHCRLSLEASLEALQTDRVDVLLLHTSGPEILRRCDVPQILSEECAKHVRFFGASVYGTESARVAIDSGWCDCVQIAYSMLDRRPETDVLERARKKDVGVVARSVLMKGALTRRCEDLPEGLEALRETVSEAAKLSPEGLDGLPELAYRYVLSDERVHTALVGASCVEEVEQAVRFAVEGTLGRHQIYGIQKLEINEERILNPGNWPMS